MYIRCLMHDVTVSTSIFMDQIAAFIPSNISLVQHYDTWLQMVTLLLRMMTLALRMIGLKTCEQGK
jgi:hypothetical protein